MISFLGDSLLTAQNLQPVVRGDSLPAVNACLLTNGSEPALRFQLATCLKELHNDAYLEASFDRVVVVDSLLEIDFHLGKQQEWLKIETIDIPNSILKEADFRAELLSGAPIDLEQWQKMRLDLLQAYADSGFPFADLEIIQLEEKEAAWILALRGNAGNPMRIDSLLLKGSANVSSRFLQQYLGIKEGALYEQDKIDRANQKLSQLKFLQPTQKPEVIFEGKGTKATVFAQKQNASRFDVILGLLPAQGSSSLQLTGDAKIDLVNALSQGEELLLHYKNYPGKATELKTAILYPYLPAVPLGLDFRFDIYRKDSLFSRVRTRIGFDYVFDSADHLQFFYENEDGNLLSIDSSSLVQAGVLPSNHDVTNSYYGLLYQRTRLDNLWNPQKGYFWNIELAAGRRVIPKNNRLLEISDPEQNGFDAEALYSGSDLDRLRLRAKLNIGKHFKLSKRTSLLTQFRGASLLANGTAQDNDFDSERFFIGGNSLLRGFDEESIITSSYGMMTLEFRYLLGLRAYTFLFADWAEVSELTTDLSGSQMSQSYFSAYGTGAGLSLETPAGTIVLSYAVGGDRGAAPRFGAGKVHIGYVSLF